MTSVNSRAINVHTPQEKNCQQFNHRIGSYAIRSMADSVPAGLNSQLQCYPSNTDKAVTADHNTCEQELTVDNKAMVEANGEMLDVDKRSAKTRASNA